MLRERKQQGGNSIRALNTLVRYGRGALGKLRMFFSAASARGSCTADVTHMEESIAAGSNQCKRPRVMHVPDISHWEMLDAASARRDADKAADVLFCSALVSFDVFREHQRFEVMKQY